jgi:hypothetical protein
LGLVVAIIVLFVYLRANDLTREAIRLNQEGLSLNQRGLDEMRESNKTNRKAIELNEQSVELTRQSVSASEESVKAAQAANEISKKSVELTEQMVSSSREELQLAKKGYEISNQSLRVENTPWLGIEIKKVTITGSGGFQSEINIESEITNHSDKPAENLWVSCNVRGIGEKTQSVDLTSLSNRNLAVMPKLSVSYSSHVVFFYANADLRTIKDMIDKGKATIGVLVVYEDTLGNKNNFYENFRTEDGIYKIVSLEFNVDPLKTFGPSAANFLNQR